MLRSHIKIIVQTRMAQDVKNVKVIFGELLKCHLNAMN